MSKKNRYRRRQTEPRNQSTSPNRVKIHRGHDSKFRLSELETGDRGVVVGIDTVNEKNLQILLSMGILPGRRIEVLQTFPSYIFQVEETQYAFDARIADAIYVKIEEFSGSPQPKDTQRPNLPRNNSLHRAGSRGVFRRFTQLFLTRP